VQAAARIGNVKLMQQLLGNFGCLVDDEAAWEAMWGGHLAALVYNEIQPSAAFRAKYLIAETNVLHATELGNLEMVE